MCGFGTPSWTAIVKPRSPPEHRGRCQTRQHLRHGRAAQRVIRSWGSVRESRPASVAGVHHQGERRFESHLTGRRRPPQRTRQQRRWPSPATGSVRTVPKEQPAKIGNAPIGSRSRGKESATAARRGRSWNRPERASPTGQALLASAGGSHRNWQQRCLSQGTAQSGTAVPNRGRAAAGNDRETTPWEKSIDGEPTRVDRSGLSSDTAAVAWESHNPQGKRPSPCSIVPPKGDRQLATLAV
jgi:hypothetical protein